MKWRRFCLKSMMRYFGQLMNNRKRRLTISLALLVCIAVILMAGCSRFPSIDGYAAETLVSAKESPDHLHCLSVYQQSGAGATVAESVTVFISSIGDGERYQDKEIWCILLAYPCGGEHFEAEWVDNESVIVNGYDDRNPEMSEVLYIYHGDYLLPLRPHTN